MKVGDYAGAVDDYTRALLIKSDGEIQTHRGWAFFFADAPGLALRDFEEALRLNPGSVDAFIGRGLARVALGQAGEAVTDAEEALRRAPATPEMLHNIACIFAQAVGRWESSADPAQRDALMARDCGRAIDAIRQALALVPRASRTAFWRDSVLPDRYLDPIRRRAEFREFARRLEDDLASPGP